MMSDHSTRQNDRHSQFWRMLRHRLPSSKQRGTQSIFRLVMYLQYDEMSWLLAIQCIINFKPVWGQLVPIDGSSFRDAIPLDRSHISWGRDYCAHLDHAIPRIAINISTWGMRACICTDAPKGIKVNGVLLKRLNSEFQKCKGVWWKIRRSRFGYLCSGDIIEVFNANRRYLRFRCDFVVGGSMKPRATDDKFKVFKHTVLQYHRTATRWPKRGPSHLPRARPSKLPHDRRARIQAASTCAR